MVGVHCHPGDVCPLAHGFRMYSIELVGRNIELLQRRLMPNGLGKTPSQGARTHEDANEGHSDFAAELDMTSLSPPKEKLDFVP
jgi:hypothetical protein